MYQLNPGKICGIERSGNFETISKCCGHKQACRIWAGFPNRGRLVGGQFGQNSQKLHENYKIGIFGSKQWEEDMWGQANFSGSGGGSPH